MSSSLLVLAIITTLTVALSLFEFWRHQKWLERLPHRIHVNGTRGKSSVTRLIGAGLSAGGIRAITKVTGTFPRLILEDGSEVEVHRRGDPSILEQLEIIEFAAKRKAEALVIECMALDPKYQWISENQMVRSTMGVMTNVRLDHTDVMGSTRESIGRSMSGTMSQLGPVYTADSRSRSLLQQLAEERGSVLQFVDRATVAPNELERFSYLEHAENVAVALAVCADLGVERELALQGMVDARPDAGVLTRSIVARDGMTVRFFNAFAANDIDSSRQIWQQLDAEGQLPGTRVILINSRFDREDRSRQLAQLVGRELADEVDAVVLMGTPTDAVVRMLRSEGLDGERSFDLGDAVPAEVFDALFEHATPTASVVAIGNMGGQGAATVELFAARESENRT